MVVIQLPTNIDITVTFSGIVYVAGTPTLLLETGVTDRYASYLSGSGSNVLTFRYSAQAGDYSTDLDYVSSSALSLNGGAIYDVIGNANLTLPIAGSSGSLGVNKNIAINIDDGINPSVLSIKRKPQFLPLPTQMAQTFQVTFSKVVTGVAIDDFIVHPQF